MGKYFYMQENGAKTEYNDIIDSLAKNTKLQSFTDATFEMANVKELNS